MEKVQDVYEQALLEHCHYTLSGENALGKILTVIRDQGYIDYHLDYPLYFLNIKSGKSPVKSSFHVVNPLQNGISRAPFLPYVPCVNFKIHTTFIRFESAIFGNADTLDVHIHF